MDLFISVFSLHFQSDPVAARFQEYLNTEIWDKFSHALNDSEANGDGRRFSSSEEETDSGGSDLSSQTVVVVNPVPERLTQLFPDSVFLQTGCQLDTSTTESLLDSPNEPMPLEMDSLIPERGRSNVFLDVDQVIEDLKNEALEIEEHTMLNGSTENTRQSTLVEHSEGADMEIEEDSGRGTIIEASEESATREPPNDENNFNQDTEEETTTNVAVETKEDSSSPVVLIGMSETCLLYTSPSPRDLSTSRMPSSA